MLLSRRAIGRLAGFGSSTLLGSAVSIVTIPVLIARIGAGPWSNLAIGQAVGTFFAVVVAFGWGVTGPSSIAVRAPAERRQYYLQSVRIRSVLLLIAAAPAAVTTALVVHDEWAASIVTALSLLVFSLAGGWFYVGIGDSRALLLFETAPRVAGTVVGAALVVAGAGALAFALAQLLVGALSLIGPVVVARRLPRGTPGEVEPLSPPLAVLRGQSTAVLVAATAALYVNAPLVAIGIAAPGAAATYAVGDRILKFSLNVLTPVGQTIQGWVPSRDRAVLVQRCLTAMRASFLLGAVGSVVVLVLLLFGSSILTSGQVRIEVALAVPFALTFGVIAVSRIVGLVCLVALDAVPALAVSTIAGAVVGVLALAVLTPIAGALGAALAFLVSEAAVTGSQLFSLSKAVRTERDQ